MTALQAAAPDALDETARGFVSTFMTQVALLTGYGKNRLTTIAHIKTLLLAALARSNVDDDGAAQSEWRALYRAITDLLEVSFYAHDTRDAYAYLRAFVQENADLA